MDRAGALFQSRGSEGLGTENTHQGSQPLPRLEMEAQRGKQSQGQLRTRPTCGHGDVTSIAARADCRGHGPSCTRRRSVRCRGLEACLPIPAEPLRCSETSVVLPCLDFSVPNLVMLAGPGLKSRDITLLTKVHLVKAMVFQSCMGMKVGP